MRGAEQQRGRRGRAEAGEGWWRVVQRGERRRGRATRHATRRTSGSWQRRRIFWKRWPRCPSTRYQVPSTAQARPADGLVIVHHKAPLASRLVTPRPLGYHKHLRPPIAQKPSLAVCRCRCRPALLLLALALFLLPPLALCLLLGRLALVPPLLLVARGGRCRVRSRCVHVCSCWRSCWRGCWRGRWRSGSFGAGGAIGGRRQVLVLGLPLGRRLLVGAAEFLRPGEHSSHTATQLTSSWPSTLIFFFCCATGPRPHLRGYVSRSMMQRLTLATTPWSQLAMSTVDICAYPSAIASPLVVMSTTSSCMSMPASARVSRRLGPRRSGSSTHRSAAGPAP